MESKGTSTRNSKSARDAVQVPPVHRNWSQYAIREHDREAGQSASHKHRVGLLSEVYFRQSYINPLSPDVSLRGYGVISLKTKRYFHRFHTRVV